MLILTSCVRRPHYDSMTFLQERSHPKPYKEMPMIVIDAGHGGKDEGCSPKQKEACDEKELTIKTVRLVQMHLKTLGYRVVLTRKGDEFVSLDERAALANRLGSELFVSVHFNSAKNKGAHGIEIFYCDEESIRTEQSKLLAEKVLDKVITCTEAKSRGVKTANFRVIKDTNMPAILVEGGFLSHQEERKLCEDPIYQNALAWGIAKGIDTYLKERPRRDSNARPAA